MDFDRLFEFLRECSNFWMVVRFFLSHCECGCPIWNRTWVVVFEIMGGCFEFLRTLQRLFEFLGAWVRTVLVVRRVVVRLLVRAPLRRCMLRCGGTLHGQR